MSGLNLRNRNTEKSQLHRAGTAYIFHMNFNHVVNQYISIADNRRYGQLAAPNTATTG